MVQNFYYLNEWTVKNNYPLLLISDIENIGMKKVFCHILSDIYTGGADNTLLQLPSIWGLETQTLYFSLTYRVWMSMPMVTDYPKYVRSKYY